MTRWSARFAPSRSFTLATRASAARSSPQLGALSPFELEPHPATVAAASTARTGRSRRFTARLDGDDRKPTRPGERVVAVVEVDDAVVDVREGRAVPGRLERIARARVPGSDGDVDAAAAREPRERGPIEEEVRGELVVPNVELAVLLQGRTAIERPPQGQTDPCRAHARGQPALLADRKHAVTAVASGPAGLLVLGGVARVANGGPADSPGRGHLLGCDADEGQAATAGGEPRGPHQAPRDGHRLVGRPARVALARVVAKPARHVQIAPAALAGERHADELRALGSAVGRAAGGRAETGQPEDAEHRDRRARPRTTRPSPIPH